MNCLNKIITINDFIDLKSNGIFHNKNIVFTNGCFDILHSGHILYLEEASKLGDILILGLNSDNSVKRLKGQSRPINNQQDRAIVLSGLQSVSYIIIFEEDTPFELIKIINPDILVKGGDWKAEQIVGSDLVLKNGGVVKSLSFKEGKSTSNIIDNILKG
ncbi:MAG: D-glycero-beta-D-manno-heptose 1-phosphate adenylyltransferase [Candidatus Cloacimonetes bacterium]|jgi:D-beta-D-heptose 7-phosphate kinase/D-beta-D-heptose 1-phosphate adenosyltransferase|nr:D-glycero-beta-D-manno-heptose 1-phosphate adenylyltransferase [Candidatus Cloacimonadota bacterium]MDD4156691.1 D-glycero-beta-D-manno-heptose 1-phosphate adenylyltransferase [Candidatus Cloacimonadota bacterium]